METLASTQQARASWRELQNKLEAFTCFSYADQLDRGPMDAYRRLWMIEGWGYQQAEAAVKGKVADHDLVPLHTGMGLAFACRALQASVTIADRICMFLELCNRHALQGYHGACYEALGLAARNLYPESVRGCEQNLPQDLREYFWHGVGRGLYFIPTNLPPLASAPWRSVPMAAHEPPDPVSRLNAISGLVWAVALVNIRHPEVLELFRLHHADDVPATAYHNGACCALRVWNASTATSSVRDDGPPGEWFRYVNDQYVRAKH